jgi:hypothetical protein
MSYHHDPVFQTVQQIRTPGAVAEILATAWRQWCGTAAQAVRVTPGALNYKPFQRARLLAEAIIVPAGNAPAVALPLFLHVFADANTASAEAARGLAQVGLSEEIPPLIHVPQWRTVIWLLPHAPNLPELGYLLQAERFCHDLLPSTAVSTGRPYYPAPKLVRYVPLKRAILTWDDPYAQRRYFVKLINSYEAARVAQNFMQMHTVYNRGELGFAVPQCITYHPAYHTLVMTEVAGSSFTGVMCHALPRSFVPIGRMLAQLHGSSASPEMVWAPARELTILKQALTDFTRALPHHTAALNCLMARLEAVSQTLPFVTNRPIHGNLFGDQILVCGGAFGMVDWDTLMWGDPLYDVGRLLAHLIYLGGREGIAPATISACANALIESYVAETGQSINRHCLAWHVATQILLRGKTSSFRQLAMAWETHVAFVVAEATHILDGQSRYLSLPALHDVVAQV